MPRARAAWMVAAAALFLGLWGIGQAFRSDEVWSLRAVAMPWDRMMEELRGDVHPPLYYWLLRAWTRVAGTGERGARLLSLLLGLAAAGVVHRMARDWFGPRGALLAAAVFASSPLIVMAEQFVRMYALLALASAVSMGMFLRLSLGGRVRGRDLAWYVAANIVGTFTHVWFFFLLLGQGAAHLVLRRFSRLGWMTLAAALSLAPYGLYWLPVLLRQIRTTDRALAWATQPGAGDAAGALMLLGWFWWLAIPAFWRVKPRHPHAAALACMVTMAVALAVPFALSFWKPVFWARFTIVTLPALALAVGSLAPEKERVRFEPAVMAAVCLVAFVVAGFYQSRCDSRFGAEFLREHARVGDLVVFTNMSRLPVDHYWRNAEIEARSFPKENDGHPGFDGPAPLETLEREAGEIAGAGRRVIVFHGFRPKKEAVLMDRIEQTMRRVDSLCRECEAMGSYYNRISVFDPR